MSGFQLGSRVNKITYRAGRHYLFGWTLRRWCIVILPALIALSAFNFLPDGQTMLIGVSLTSAGIFALFWRARRNGYLRFEVEDDNIPANNDASPLSFSDKILVQASGNFAVQGKNRYFTEEQAYYRCSENVLENAKLVISFQLSVFSYRQLTTDN